jgi:hypothetical protein
MQISFSMPPQQNYFSPPLVFHIMHKYLQMPYSPSRAFITFVFLSPMPLFMWCQLAQKGYNAGFKAVCVRQENKLYLLMSFLCQVLN